jgi:acetylornithine deacetylase
MDVIALTKELVSIPSITNDEGTVGIWIADRLEAQGWHVTRQEIPVEGGAKPKSPRINVLATSDLEGPPQVVLTTHLDTVPPFLPLRDEGDYLYGRGTCDAKGIFAAQWVAAERLRQAGVKGIALLGVVGEETDSWGAKAVHEILPRAKYLIDGEPTLLVPASGAKGILALEVRAKGRAAHSAYPELGHSAIHDLIPALSRILAAEWPSLPAYGETTVNVGLVQGGAAPNVLAPSATANVLFRLAAPSGEILPLVEKLLGPALEYSITSRAEAHPILVPKGKTGEVVRFGSDVPYLQKIGTPLLFGPGSIHDAHTSGEKVKKQDLIDSVDLYAETTQLLLEGNA